MPFLTTPCSFQPPLQRLFDSSRFNYDSDEEEEDEQQHSAAAEAREQQQQGAAASPGEEGDGGVLEVPLPPPRGVRVKTAEFIKSSVHVAQCPPPRFPEFAGGWAGLGAAAWPAEPGGSVMDSSLRRN